MENEKFKKMAILGLCLFFMVGMSACMSQREFTQFMIYSLLGLALCTATVYFILLGFKYHPKITIISVICMVILICLYSQFEIHRATQAKKVHDVNATQNPK